jgi:hypothetical protein
MSDTPTAWLARLKVAFPRWSIWVAPSQGVPGSCVPPGCRAIA